MGGECVRRSKERFPPERAPQPNEFGDTEIGLIALNHVSCPPRHVAAALAVRTSSAIIPFSVSPTSDGSKDSRGDFSSARKHLSGIDDQNLSGHAARGV